MTQHPPRHRLALAVGLVAALALSACGGQDAEPEGTGIVELRGFLSVVAGTCAPDGTRSGSFFRMVQPGGTLEDGPFVANADSACEDKTFTPLAPGPAGGMSSGAWQPHSGDPFSQDPAVTAGILAPTTFFGVPFAVATNAVDPQTDEQTAEPLLVADEQGALSGDLSAFGVVWNDQHFNQGAPKPGGERPGLTQGPAGTYDEAPGAYSLTWSSQIAGGPFDGFTGVWHLEGTYEPDEPGGA